MVAGTSWNIEVELSDLYNILCLVTPGDSEETILTLVDALQDLSNDYYQPGRNNHVPIQFPEIPELVLSPREAFYARHVGSLEESAGRISAEFIMIYPPGIPVFRRVNGSRKKTSTISKSTSTPDCLSKERKIRT